MSKSPRIVTSEETVSRGALPDIQSLLGRLHSPDAPAAWGTLLQRDAGTKQVHEPVHHSAQEAGSRLGKRKAHEVMVREWDGSGTRSAA